METMYDKLGDLLNETLKSGQVKFKKKIKYSEKEIPHEEKKSEENFSKENGKTVNGFSGKAKAAIMKYDWPGNIRELRNCVESAVVMSSGDEINIEDLPPAVAKSSQENSIAIPFGITLDEAEKIIIQQNLASNKNN